MTWQVTTNRNRSFVFQPSAVPILKLPCGPYVRQKPKKTGITPGTTITGIYFMHVGGLHTLHPNCVTLFP